MSINDSEGLTDLRDVGVQRIMSDHDKYALLILTDAETPADRGRMVHALQLARELREAGHQVKLLLSGVGVHWAAFFSAQKRSDTPHPYAKAYGHLFDAADVAICNMCARRFDVHAEVSAAGLVIDGEDKEHLSVGRAITDGYRVLTF